MRLFKNLIALYLVYILYYIILYLCIINNINYINMEIKEKKTLLLKVNSDVYTEFKELCKREGFSMTLSLNQMIKSAIKKNKLW